MTQNPGEQDRPEDDAPPPPPSWSPDSEPPHGDPLTGHGEERSTHQPGYGAQPGYDPGYDPNYQPGYQQGYQQGQHGGYASPYQPAYNPGAPQGYGYDPAAPYGIDPRTGIPFSDKSKLVAGLLQVLIPLGIGRMYMGQTGVGVTQLLVTIFTCGIGAIWPFIDGILILVGDQRDSRGRPLRT
jgi:hypothetical protein